MPTVQVPPKGARDASRPKGAYEGAHAARALGAKDRVEPEPAAPCVAVAEEENRRALELPKRAPPKRVLPTQVPPKRALPTRARLQRVPEAGATKCQWPGEVDWGCADESEGAGLASAVRFALGRAAESWLLHVFAWTGADCGC